MTDTDTDSRPTYDDEQFRQCIDLPDTDEWISTAPITRLVGCGMLTANRRLIQLAAEGEPLEIYDPAADDRAGSTVTPDAFESVPKRALGFRRPPSDPDAAAPFEDSPYYHAASWVALAAGGTTPCKG